MHRRNGGNENDACRDLSNFDRSSFCLGLWILTSLL